MSTGTAEQVSCNWAELPADVTSTILSKVGAIDVLTSAQLVCSSWLRICHNPAMWRNIDMHRVGGLWDMNYDLEKMCRHAVNRSNGQLLSINIEYFGTDDLLHHVANRSRNLRNLRLVLCNNISDQGFCEAIKGFPLLEELELSYCSLSQEALEAVGSLCPLLKSLKFNRQVQRCPEIECDNDAKAIAANMHGLCHLQLFGNGLTNVGLQAILDGCPHLESLDLRWCFNVNLVGKLGKICAERIKDLRCPNDSTDDYEFNADFLTFRWSSAEDDDDYMNDNLYDSEFDYDVD